MKITTSSASETKKLGEVFGRELKNGLVIGLTGDLGSGKTTFIQGLARGLGIKERIVSPTFVLMRKYKIGKRKKLKNFYHIDFYRIHSDKDARHIDFEKIISDPGNIIAIEWAQRVKNILPSDILEIEFKYIDNLKRTMHFISHK